jgi:hypothetical protein
MALAACAGADHEFVKVARRVIKKSWRAIEKGEAFAVS